MVLNDMAAITLCTTLCATSRMVGVIRPESIASAFLSGHHDQSEKQSSRKEMNGTSDVPTDHCPAELSRLAGGIELGGYVISQEQSYCILRS